MEVKWIGALLVFLSCSSVGYIKAAQYRKQERYLADLIRILDFMTCELTYRLSPLPQVCKAAAEMSFGCLNEVFLLFSQELELQTAVNARSCMQICIERIKDIPDKLRSVLVNFSESIGAYDLSGQLIQINAVQAQCSSQLEQIRAYSQQRIRNYQTLALCAGAGLAILLF